MIKKIIILVLLISISGFLNAKQPPAISTGGSKLNVMFLVDTSGSMYNKYTYVQQALRKVVQDPNLASSANFSLLTWGSYSCTWRGSSSSVYCPSQRTFAGYRYQYSYRYVYNGCYGRYRYYSYYSRRYYYYYRYYSCYKYTYTRVPYYTYQNVHTFVPFSSDKARNQRDILNGIARINSAGGGTNIAPPMQFAQAYLRSSEFKRLSNTSNCGDKTLIIVLSDGIWYNGSTGEAIARGLASTESIKTYAVAFGTSPTYSTFSRLTQAGQTYPAMGSTSLSSTLLVNSFMKAIGDTEDILFSTVAPTIMADINAGDMILTPTFKYKPNKQWIGRLKARSLDVNGKVGAQRWDFGNNLNQIHPDSRRIWTAASGVNTPTPTNQIRLPNNFVWNSSNTINQLATHMETSSTLAGGSAYWNAYNLIRFVRGYDVWNEDNQSDADGRPPRSDWRWKLNDIWNSQPYYVGKPNISVPSHPNYTGGIKYFADKDPAALSNYKNINREPVVYVGSNAGMLHAVRSRDGQELWGFIPPPLLNKLKGVITSTSGKTNSIYGVDGELVAKDVYVKYRGRYQWRTYLVITLGNGAQGFSVLDVTDPYYPQHIFSIENQTDLDTNRRAAVKWDSAGNKTTISDYLNLGYTTSAPIISYYMNSGNYEPVLVLGGGSSNSGLANELGDVGSVAYMISLNEDNLGEVLNSVDFDEPDTPKGSFIVKNAYPVSNSTQIRLTSSGYGIGIGSIVSSDDEGDDVPLNTTVTRVNGYYITLSNAVTLTQSTNLSFSKRLLNEMRAPVEVVESGAIDLMNGKYGFKLIIPNNNGIINSYELSSSAPSTINVGDIDRYRIINTLGTFGTDEVIQQRITLTNETQDPQDDVNLLYGTGDMDNISALAKVPDNKIISIQNSNEDFFTNNKTRKNNWKRMKGSMRYYNSANDWLGFYLENYTFFDASTRAAPSCKSTDQEGWYVKINNIYAYDKDRKRYSCRSGKLSTQLVENAGITTGGVFIPPAVSTTCQSAVGDSAIIFRNTKCGTESFPGIYLNNTLVGGIAVYKNKLYISVSSDQKSGQVSNSKFVRDENIISGDPGFKSSSTSDTLKIESKQRVH